jgi:hypothetical protein
MTLTIAEYEALRAARRALLGFEDSYGLQIWNEEPTESQVTRVTAPPSYAEVLRALGPVPRREVCRGGTVQVMSDDWENCRGCCGCAGAHTAGYRATYSEYRDRIDASAAARAQFEACRAIGIFVWRAAQLPAHAALYRSVAGFEALAQIGRQIAAVAAIGYAISAFVRGVIAESNAVRKGHWYRIEGKCGKAKAHHGVEGECVWIGESTYEQERPAGWRGTWRGRTSSTLRAGILPLGADKAIYVPASSLAPTKAPTEGVERATQRARARAERGVRPNYYGRTGRKADVGYVVSGPHRGTTGQVFWSKIFDVLGADGRVGVKTSKGAEPLWIGARDVVGPAKRFAEFAKFEFERVADGESGAKTARLDAVIAGAYACAEALVDAGFDAAAEEWAAVATQIACWTLPVGEEVCAC